MKKPIQISADIEIWRKFMEKHPRQASAMINEFMRKNVSTSTEMEINIELERMELIKKKKEYAKLDKQIKEHEEKIEFYAEMEEAKEKARLLEKKEQIALVEECSFCQATEGIKNKNGHIRKYKGKIYCYSCYMKGLK